VQSNFCRGFFTPVICKPPKLAQFSGFRLILTTLVLFVSAAHFLTTKENIKSINAIAALKSGDNGENNAKNCSVNQAWIYGSSWADSILLEAGNRIGGAFPGSGFP